MYVKEVKKNAYRYYPEKIPEGLICMSQKGGELDGLDGDSWTHHCKITHRDTKEVKKNAYRYYLWGHSEEVIYLTGKGVS